MENPLPPDSTQKPFPLNRILTIITIVSLALTVFFIYQNQQLQKKLDQIIQAQITPIPTLQVLIPPADPTANWKTYKNSSLGFELKYPPSVQIDKEMDDQYNRAALFKGGNLSFEVELRKIPEDFILDNYFFMDSPIKQKTILAGIPANVYEMPNGYCDGPSCSDPYIAIVAKKDSDLYAIIFYGDTQLSDDENQVLSTFKFMETPTIPSDWKTYTSAKYGYKFRYPSGLRVYGETESFVNLTYIPVCDPLVKSCLFIPSDMFKGTNFKGAGFGVSLLPSITSEKSCFTQQFKNDLGEKYINGYKFHLYADSGAAAGNQRSELVYLTFANRQCYQIIRRITTDSSDINAPSGTVNTFIEKEVESLENLLNQVLSTFILPPL